MKVRSKLADIEFRIGALAREGDTLVITNDPAQPMRSRVYVTAQDVLEFFRQLLRSPSALVFVLALPWFWLRGRRGVATTPAQAGAPRDPWDD